MEETSFVRWRIYFSGTVQHVGFRYTAYYLARGLYLTGWVDNLPDGRVVLEAQGRVSQVRKLLFQLKSQAHIKITGTEGELTGNLEEDQILLRRFGEADQLYDLSAKKSEFKGHGGGDAGLANAFVTLVEEGGEGLTSVDASVESHAMALAAHESALAKGRTILLKDYIEAHRN